MLGNSNIYNNTNGLCSSLNFNANTNINVGTNFSTTASNASGLFHKFSGYFASTPSNQIMTGSTSMLGNDDVTPSMTNWTGVDSATAVKFNFIKNS